MKKSVIPPVHGGGKLVTRILPEIEREAYLLKANEYKTYTISEADLSMFYRMADGGLSPLEGSN